MVAATQAEGETLLENVGELRVKETDRLKSMVTGLIAMGAQIQVDGPEGAEGPPAGETIRIMGPTRLKGATVDSFSDHRTAMALAVAGLVAQGATTIRGADSVAVSFPEFFDCLKAIS